MSETNTNPEARVVEAVARLAKAADDKDAATRADRIARGWPVPYLLDDPAEHLRLLREVYGYLHTCRKNHHGTDFEGRQFAMDALKRLTDAALPTPTLPPAGDER